MKIIFKNLDYGIDKEFAVNDALEKLICLSPSFKNVKNRLKRNLSSVFDGLPDTSLIKFVTEVYPAVDKKELDSIVQELEELRGEFEKKQAENRGDFF